MEEDVMKKAMPKRSAIKQLIREQFDIEDNGTLSVNYSHTACGPFGTAVTFNIQWWPDETTKMEIDITMPEFIVRVTDYNQK